MELSSRGTFQLGNYLSENCPFSQGNVHLNIFLQGDFGVPGKSGGDYKNVLGNITNENITIVWYKGSKGEPGRQGRRGDIGDKGKSSKPGLRGIKVSLYVLRGPFLINKPELKIIAKSLVLT